MGSWFHHREEVSDAPNEALQTGHASSRLSKEASAQPQWAGQEAGNSAQEQRDLGLSRMRVRKIQHVGVVLQVCPEGPRRPLLPVGRRDSLVLTRPLQELSQ